MSPKSRLTLKVDQISEELTVEADIPDDEWRVLEDFVSSAHELLETKFVASGMQSSLKIKKEMNSDDIKVEASLPLWDDVMVFLHRLRPIYLERESTSFFRVANILGRRFEHPRIRGMLKGYRDLYSGKILRSSFEISSNDVVVNSDEVLSRWLNSYEYHRDPDKRVFIERLHEVFPVDASKVLFIALLVEKVKAIASLSSLASVVIGKSSSERLIGLVET